MRASAGRGGALSLVLLIAGLAVLVPLAVLDGVFLTEVLLGLRPGTVTDAASGPMPSLAVLIPAHDEAAGLGERLAALRATLPPAARILVVADNCSDATAAVARAAGVEVIERHDPARRGKGYALAFGRDHLAARPPAVAMVLDADCSIEPRGAERLARAAAAHGRPVQGAYLFRPRAAASAIVQVSGFAFAVKNLVRQRGARRIGAAAILGGSGMAFPWQLFATLDLATGEVVEDLALGVELVRRGEPPLFEEGATIWSDPSGDAGTATQRARWEGGFLGIARAQALPLIADGMRRRRWTMIWLGLHLLTPPLTLLLAGNVAAVLLLGGLALLGMPGWPLAAAALLLAAVGGAVLAAWVAVGRAQLPAGRLLRLPLYLAWKVALHLRLASGRERVAWTRTERVDEER